MTERQNAEKAIRKSLETALHEIRADLRLEVPENFRTMPAYGSDAEPEFPIWWPNIGFYDAENEAKPPVFIRVTHHFQPPRARTVGETPRLWLRGYILLGLHTPERSGEDLMDNLANAAMDAYPYQRVFSRDGFDTHVEIVDPRAAFGSNGRYYKPVHVNWNCWRSS